MAGIGEKPMIRSGPYFLMVKALAAAIISVAVSQSARTKPPCPRNRLYSRALSGFWLIDAQASIATVARLTGFGHPENLRRSFQKHLSVSPRDFYQRFG